MKKEQKREKTRLIRRMVLLLIELIADYMLLLKEARIQADLKKTLHKDKEFLQNRGWHIRWADCSLYKERYRIDNSMIHRAKAEAFHIGMDAIIVTSNSPRRIIALRKYKKWLVKSEMLRLLIIIPLTVISIIGVAIFMIL